MTNLLEYEGDLLAADVDVIAHQCNCVSRGAAGLAYLIFTRWPQTNTYGNHPQPDKYGTYDLIEVEGAPFSHVLNLYTQLNTGRPVFGAGRTDNAQDRLLTFEAALSSFITEHPGIYTKIGFPKNFGSVLAGGVWEDYRDVIVRTAGNHPEIEFHIVEKK